MDLNFRGFSKLTLEERWEYFLKEKLLSPEQIEQFKKSDFIYRADQFIENVVGVFELPLGVVVGVRVDDKDYIVPMAIEETSIIAAASKTARWVKESGFIKTWQEGTCVIGQVQIAKIQSQPEEIEKTFTQYKSEWIQFLNENISRGLAQRGGGVKDILIRWVLRESQSKMAVFHLLVDPVDAMGANIVNQICESFKSLWESRSDEKVSLCILSNLVDTRLTGAQIEIPNVDSDFGTKIQEASLFAELDPYRAATSNKGVMNGIDGLLIATGNDWRAVEAGMHAYACREGRYQSLTQWRYQEGRLIGRLKAPLILGIVGGVTKNHPLAQWSLKLMNIESSSELSRLAAAMGLIQNLGALRALVGEGISQGHMKLHIQNLILQTDVSPIETHDLRQRAEIFLKQNKKITLFDVQQLLETLRHENSSR